MRVLHLFCVILFFGCVQQALLMNAGRTNVENRRAFVWGTVETDQCVQFSAWMHIPFQREIADTLCYQTLRAFQGLPDDDKELCPNAREPAICRLIPPTGNTYKCSFMCDITEEQNPRRRGGRRGRGRRDRDPEVAEEDRSGRDQGQQDAEGSGSASQRGSQAGEGSRSGRGQGQHMTDAQRSRREEGSQVAERRRRRRGRREGRDEEPVQVVVTKAVELAAIAMGVPRFPPTPTPRVYNRHIVSTRPGDFNHPNA